MELAKQKIWLWRPKTKPISPILEENYLCCFGKCTALQTFRAINYTRLCLFGSLFAILFGRWAYYQVVLEPYEYSRMDLSAFLNMMAIVFINLLTALLAVVCFETLKPVWTQVYLIYVNIGAASGLFWSGSTFLWKFGVLCFNVGPNHPTYIDQFLGWENDYDSDHGVKLFVSTLASCLLFCYYAWELMITYSFYHYVRDKQLETEGQAVFAGFSNRNHLNGYQMFPNWCWMPKQRSDIQSPVSRNSYRTCCCSVIPVFRAMLCLQLVLLAIPITLIGYNWESFRDNFRRDEIYQIILVLIYFLLVVVLGLFSTFRRKPFYTQIYMLFSVVNWGVIGTGIVGWMVFVVVDNVIRIIKDPRILVTVNEDLAKYVGFQITTAYPILGLLAIPALLELIFVWQFRVIWTYYRFVRDRQLELENYHDTEDRLTEEEYLSENQDHDQIINDEEPPLLSTQEP